MQRKYTMSKIETVKTSKRKSKNSKKQQNQPLTKILNNKINGIHENGINTISESLGKCLHINENGCCTNKFISDDNSDDDKSNKSISSIKVNRKLSKAKLYHIIPLSKQKTVDSDIIVTNCGLNITNDKFFNELTANNNGSADNDEILNNISEQNDCENYYLTTNLNILNNSQNNFHKEQNSDYINNKIENLSDNIKCQEQNKNVINLPKDPLINNDLNESNITIEYKEYESELQMQDIMQLIQTELSEPYSIYTYRYFIYNWPKLCFLAAHGNEYVGAIVCKLDMHIDVKRGYIAMLAVKKDYRKMKIGTSLVRKAIEAMVADGADEVVLETEMKNIPALRLYENLGFVRDKRLFRYYLNGVDALRLKLWLR